MMTMRDLKEDPVLGAALRGERSAVQQAHTTLSFIPPFGVIVVNLGV
jgi:hypothetical protein